MRELFSLDQHDYKEGGKVFGEGSQLTVSIILLIMRRDKIKGEPAKIFYYAVEDGLTQNEKLNLLLEYKSFGRMLEKNLMSRIIPNDFMTKSPP